jgi:acetyl-CoA carboxylase biotin carboxyl carrier protein
MALPGTPVPSVAAPSEAVSTVASESSAAAPPPSAADDLHVIKSPIVGTFYAAPNPEAGPFVKVGDTVEAGQTVCIIEAMKLMNEIEADISGEVVRILVENGQPVEYGESLFALRPAGKKK